MKLVYQGMTYPSTKALALNLYANGMERSAASDLAKRVEASQRRREQEITLRPSQYRLER